jgi:hypothetical protein
MPEILKREKDSVYKSISCWSYPVHQEKSEDLTTKMFEEHVSLRRRRSSSSFHSQRRYTNPTEDIFGWIKKDAFVREIKNSELDVLGAVANPTTCSFVIENRIVEIPIALSSLEQAINDSKYILELEEGWDGENGKPFSKDTWSNAVNFLIDYATWIYKNTGKAIDSPDIVHSVDGSIELLWQKEKFRIIISLPENSEMALFYGDDYEEVKIEGTVSMKNIKSGLALAISDLF